MLLWNCISTRRHVLSKNTKNMDVYPVCICISDALAMAVSISSKIAVVALCIAETWITAAMTVRSVQTVLSTGNDFNQDSDYKTSMMKATSTLPSVSTTGSYTNFISCGTTTTSMNASGGQPLWYTFCPNISGVANISTCGSTVDTWLQVRGPWSSVDVSCDDCGSCGLQAETSIKVINGVWLVISLPLIHAVRLHFSILKRGCEDDNPIESAFLDGPVASVGVCYEILVYGFSGGNYVLSTSCQAVNPPEVGCGSVSGSIVGLPNYFGADGGGDGFKMLGKSMKRHCVKWHFPNFATELW